ncbi:MAG: phosphoribosylamine--glycine ligase [Myxococcota bacterium]|nr:phosphoribosylamine--glycine ligase [Myxococcota bacterium]
MKIMVIGNGGREHAICRALTSGDNPPELVIVPGNPGTAECGTNVDCSLEDIDALVALARVLDPDFVVVGPEQPLVHGVTDALLEAKIPCCGPSQSAALLEGSKDFTREIANLAGVPSPIYKVVTSESALRGAIEDWDGLPVIKADGLAGGKGVFLPETKAEGVNIGLGLLAGKLGDAGKTIVLEERLFGVEASLFYACDGENALLLPHARDHKRLLDGDQGPNTGGMGAISPNPLLDDKLLQEIHETCIVPTLETLKKKGIPFRGFLFGGFMLTEKGPKLLEYNVRLGDPETQAILPRIENGQFLELCARIANGKLRGFKLAEQPFSTCAIVVAAAGYPEKPRKGDRISVSMAAKSSNEWLIHAATRLESGELQTSGGRVLAIVAKGTSPENARSHAYKSLEKIQFEGMQFRKDIGESKYLGVQS